MYFDLANLGGKLSYKLLSSTVVPRPIAWVTTRSDHGHLNAAPFSFFNVFSGEPPVACLGIGEGIHGPKDTVNNLRANGELVINLVSESNVVSMNITATAFESEIDELEEAGLATVASTHVAPPRIAASPASFECRVREIIPLGTANHLILVNVLAAHIIDEAITDVDRCRIDASRLDLVGRMESPGWYVRTRDRFMLKQQVKPLRDA
ncbi:flavin reductase family protein [Variovorax sp. KK3]|uniref:flavin reductase family protein n=1 Tax=Variovorax sp. KK3 TaxID=1855728 RepID=UPI00097BBE59|nr:flavin reductase family protein [Variovorax sp. KK3]